MRKLLSVRYSASAFNTAIFVLRVAAGVLLAAHGYHKLIHFQEISGKFMSFWGISPSFSLAMAIFAELFCSIFVILGLFTRLATIPILVTMLVALFKAHNADVFGQGEKAALFFLIFFTVLLVGPGRASIDGAINK